jgi:hypothetical protein
MEDDHIYCDVHAGGKDRSASFFNSFACIGRRPRRIIHTNRYHHALHVSSYYLVAMDGWR